MISKSEYWKRFNKAAEELYEKLCDNGGCWYCENRGKAGCAHLIEWDGEMIFDEAFDDDKNGCDNYEPDYDSISDSIETEMHRNGWAVTDSQLEDALYAEYDRFGD